MTLPPSYSSWLEPDEPCCDLPGCDGQACQADAQDDHDAALEARAEADRDAERDDAQDARVRRG